MRPRVAGALLRGGGPRFGLSGVTGQLVIRHRLKVVGHHALGASAKTGRGERRKISVETLLAGLRPLVKGRNEANTLGLVDNQGAITSIERVLDILRIRLVHGIAHTSNLKHDPNIEGTKEAFAARARGDRVDIEHVYPRREVAQAVCDLVTRGASDRTISNYIIKTSRVVLLTPSQRAAVDSVPGNRSRYAPNRLKSAGLKVFKQPRKR